MNLDLPTLSTSDLQEELRDIHRRERRALTAAVFGRGEPGMVTVELRDRRVLFRAAPVRSELEMRRALAQEGEDPVVLLVDFPVPRLPADLAGRLAGGKVHAVDRGRRLARMFGAAAAGTELRACRPLCDALLTRPVSWWRIQGSTVDLDTAWRALLARDARLPFEGALTEERVVDFCASAPVVPAFVKALADNGGKLRATLLQHLGDASGPVAVIAWCAWERSEGRAVASLAFVLEVAARKLPGHAYLLGQVRTAMARLDPELRKLPPDAPLFGRWGELGPVMARRLSPSVLDLALTDADAILQDEPVSDVLIESRWLTGAFALSAKALGEALVAAMASPGPDAMERADAASKRLQNHRLARVDDSNEQRLAARAEMALKLVAYLATRAPLEAELRELGEHDVMRTLAEHYAEHGAYVDAARAAARGETLGPLAQGIEAVLSAVDRARDLDDERFAKGLASWVEAGSPSSSRVVPIERALDEVAVNFLKEKPHRRLLVVLLDGMAWANAVELLPSLEEAHIAPVRWRRGRLPPMLAALPTTTTVSRAALFKGKRLEPGETEDTAKDPARFAAHKGLAKLLDQAPQLYLRPDVETATGELSKKAALLVQSKDRVVAVVVNAIDDQLKGSRQMRVPCDLVHIKPLGPLLQEATDAGRAVLLVADHGHVLGARMASVSAPEAGPKRWRALGVNEAPGPNEVSVSADSTWRPRGKAKVALLFRETDAYGGSPHVGEHGGASLAEVVSPAILVASDRLRQRIQLEEGEDDEALEVTPFPSPPWWDLRVRKAAARAAPVDTASAPEQLPAPVKQLSIPLLEVAPPKPTKERKGTPRQPAAPAGDPAEVRPPSPGVSVMLARSMLLKERQRERGTEPRAGLMAWVDILAAHQGPMAARLFAREAGLLAHQAAGAVSEMSEWLNVDTYQVVTYDRGAQEVRLDLDLLQALFGAD